MTTEVTAEKMIKLPAGIFAMKHRTTWACGYSRWEWSLFLRETNHEEIEETGKSMAEQSHEDNSWSDKYRGFEWEIYDEAPEKFVMSILKNTYNKIESLTKDVSILTSILVNSGETKDFEG